MFIDKRKLEKEKVNYMKIALKTMIKKVDRDNSLEYENISNAVSSLLDLYRQKEFNVENVFMRIKEDGKLYVSIVDES